MRPCRSKTVDFFATGICVSACKSEQCINSGSFMVFNRLQLLKIDSYAFSILIQCLWIYLFCSTEKLDVRLGYDLCREEQEFLQKRKRVVASALKRVFHLERDLREHEVCELESKHRVWAH